MASPSNVLELLHQAQSTLADLQPSDVTEGEETAGASLHDAVKRLVETARDLLTRSRKRYPSESKERVRARVAAYHARKRLLNPSLCHAQAEETLLTTIPPMEEETNEKLPVIKSEDPCSRLCCSGIGVVPGDGLLPGGIPANLFGEEGITESVVLPRIDPSTLRWSWLREVPAREREHALKFQEFYASYPRKVAPKEAWKAFRKLQNEWCETLQETINRFVLVYAQRTADPQFLSYPATFLNKRLWESEIDVSLKTGTNTVIGCQGVPDKRKENYYSAEAVARFEAEREKEEAEERVRLKETIGAEEWVTAKNRVAAMFGGGHRTYQQGAGA